jgi:hypothetical protein
MRSISVTAGEKRGSILVTYAAAARAPCRAAAEKPDGWRRVRHQKTTDERKHRTYRAALRDIETETLARRQRGIERSKRRHGYLLPC